MKLSIPLGNDRTFPFHVKGDIDISTYGIIFSVSTEKPDASPDIQKKNANATGDASQISMTNSTTGYFQVIIKDTDQAALSAGDFWFDIQFIIDSKYFTQMVDRFIITEVVKKS